MREFRGILRFGRRLAVEENGGIRYIVGSFQRGNGREECRLRQRILNGEENEKRNKDGDDCADGRAGRDVGGRDDGGDDGDDEHLRMRNEIERDGEKREDYAEDVQITGVIFLRACKPLRNAPCESDSHEETEGHAASEQTGHGGADAPLKRLDVRRSDGHVVAIEEVLGDGGTEIEEKRRCDGGECRAWHVFRHERE